MCADPGNGEVGIWYREPAEAWYDGFPLGNGSIGVIHFGGIENDSYQFSEGTFWSGEASLDNVAPGSATMIKEIRALLAAGDYIGAEKRARKIIGRKLNYGTNLPFGTLKVGRNPGADTGNSYRRHLSLSNGISTTTYRVDGTTFTREAFTSHPDQVLVIRLSSDAPAALSCTVSLDCGDLVPVVSIDDQRTFSVTVRATERIHSDGATGVTGTATVSASLSGGQVSATDTGLRIEKADEATIYLAVATDFSGDEPTELCASRVRKALSKPYDEIRARHVADHRGLFDRVHFELPSAADPTLPMDQRIAAVCAGADDPGLYALLFQFGRYLLIGCSRSDSVLPAHLAGVWNDSVACRIGWTCDYHLDINTQMNYWIAETTNLGESQAPLFRWLQERLIPSGRRTAAELYESAGWVAHIVSNAWGFSAPGWSTGWGFFPTGGVWVASHLWYHYEFSQDRRFLSDVAYPLLKEAAEFFLDYLFEHPDPETGWLVSGPSCSPETAFLHDGVRCPLSMCPTVDRILLYELFTNCLTAARVLGVEGEFTSRVETALAKLPPYQLDREGRLQEWLEDVDNSLPHHRHTSHLLGVFPFDQITQIDTPELAAAARKALESRLDAPGGFEEGSWARNNITLFYARFLDSSKAYESLATLMRKGADRSLMAGTKNAPENAYEMDYNTGATAGICEMLLQSHRGRIHILPALPRDWAKGRITGLRARGGFEVDISWSAGRLLQSRIRSLSGLVCRLRTTHRVAVSRNGANIDVRRIDEQTVEWDTEPEQEFLVTAV